MLTVKDCLFGKVKITEILILINIFIQDMKLNMILIHIFQFQILIEVEMPLFWN